MSTTKGQAADQWARPDMHVVREHVGKKDMTLVGTDKAGGNPSTVEWAQQPVIVLDMNRVQPSVPSNGSQAGDDADGGLVQGVDDDPVTTYNGEAVLACRIP